jgi:hypothetical protein
MSESAADREEKREMRIAAMRKREAEAAALRSKIKSLREFMLSIPTATRSEILQGDPTYVWGNPAAAREAFPLQTLRDCCYARAERRLGLLLAPQGKRSKKKTLTQDPPAPAAAPAA